MPQLQIPGLERQGGSAHRKATKKYGDEWRRQKREAIRRWRLRNPEKNKEVGRIQNAKRRARYLLTHPPKPKPSAEEKVLHKREVRNAWYAKNREAIIAARRQWRIDHHEEAIAKEKGKYQRYKEKIIAYQIEYVAKNHERILARQRKAGAERALRYRQQVFDHYGWQCRCCGEDHVEFLTIDHINHGYHNPARNSGFYTHLYWRLIKAGFPEGFQTLCHNCNFGKAKKRNNGICPHETIRTPIDDFFSR